ncbi:hypothetical protein ACDH54_18635, partial [Pseudomonas syringae]
MTMKQVPPYGHCSKDDPDSWLRISSEAPGKLNEIKNTLGLDIERTLQSNLSQDGEFSYFPITFLSAYKGHKQASRVVFVLGSDTLISLEPSPAPRPLDTAMSRLQRDGLSVR